MAAQPTSGVWRGRIGVYLLGVSIGFLLVGFILATKARLVRQEALRREAAAAAAASSEQAPRP